MTDQKLCACGCGQSVKLQYMRGHNPKSHAKKPRPLCACGCGEPVRRNDKRYVAKHFQQRVQFHATKVDQARALVLHNQGQNLRAIAALFPGASRMAVLRAIRRAEAGQ
jgi:hypothetical protein